MVYNADEDMKRELDILINRGTIEKRIHEDITYAGINESEDNLCPKDPAILFELKVREKFNEVQDGIEEAFRQIRDQKYAEGIIDDGYIGSVAYGVCFCKKSCIIEKYSD